MIHRIYFVFLTLMTISISLVGAVETCRICRSEIQGAYYTYSIDNETLTLCKTCTDTLGKCSFCGIPVRFTSDQDSEVICNPCRLKAKTCSVCNRIIFHQYYIDGSDHFFCQECYREADRCGLCKTVLLPGEWSHYQRDKVCNKCMNTRPRCHACRDILGVEYSQYRGFDGKFCKHCVTHSPMCVSCMRPCGDRRFRLENGNSLCNDCFSTAVIEKDQLRTLVSEIARYMESNLLMKIDSEISFKLVNRVDGMTSSDNYRESGRFIRIGNDFTIKILAGLSRKLCIETIAHELAHAWQAENCPHLPDDELIEGFAQWVAGKVLSGYGYWQLLDRLDYRDDVYGRGYRRLIDMEKRHGFSGVFRKLNDLGKRKKK